MLLKVFATLVPIGDFAYRGNLLSALLSSAAVGTLYWVITRFCRCIRPEGPPLFWIASATLGSLVFATSPLFWSQATVTEVYALNTLFVGLLLLLASQVALRGPADEQRDEAYVTRRIALFGLLLGLGLGNHLTLLAVAVPLLLWLSGALGWRKVISPWAIGALVAGLAVYVYLPIRAAQGPPVNWGNADTVGGMMWMLSGRIYQDYVFGVALGSLPDRGLSWLELVFAQLNPLGLFIGLVGTVLLRSKQWKFLAASLASIAALSIYSITYGTPDADLLMIPAFFVFSIWVGIGFMWIISGFATRGGQGLDKARVAAVERVLGGGNHALALLSLNAFVAMPVASVILNYDSQNLRGDRGASEYASRVIDMVPDGSLVLSSKEESAFSLWYMSYVERAERDVAPIAVQLLQFDWYWEDIQARYPGRFPPESPTEITEALKRIVEHNEGGSEVFFTYRDAFLEEAFDLVAFGDLYRANVKRGE